MVTKKDLLKNVRNYSPQEIADAIRAGIVSLYDLSKETEGAFTPLLRRQVKSILDSPVSPSQVDMTESSSSAIVAPTNIEDNTYIPVVVPSIPVSESATPIMLLNDSAVDNLGQDEVTPQQSRTFIQTSEKTPTMFSRIFSFNGRIRRTEYGLTFLAYCIWNIPMRVNIPNICHNLFGDFVPNPLDYLRTGCKTMP